MYYRQEHLCTDVCAAPGICEIETAPHSIEATFRGRNETFQYTKVCCPVANACSGTDLSCSILRVRWSSCIPSHMNLMSSGMTVAKRLKCIQPIPPDATMHEGPHNHSLDKNVVHFCETRYGCRIFCTCFFLSESFRCDKCGYFCTLPLRKLRARTRGSDRC